MKNPLRKRVFRDLKSDFGKYLAVFLLMVLSISEVSGFLVADESMIAAYEESFEKYRIEHGNFTVQSPMNKSQYAAAEAAGVELNELFFAEKILSGGQKIRIFRNRTDMDRVCLMEGRLPEKAGEIAVDRMFADNNGFRIGDTIGGDGWSWAITGTVALSDYSTQFESNSDSMFDSLKFGVSVVSDDEFSLFPQHELTARYAWRFLDEPADDDELKEMSDDFLKELVKIVHIEDYVPRYLNRAITFTGEDMGSDRAMMTLFLYIITVIMAFVFAVTISSTIAKEAAVIGTLRATGYSRGELIRHYLTLPVIVTLTAALAGNILGYTVMKNLNAFLYYNSYSLPTYVTRWNGSAFFQTTVVPVVMMIVIDALILRWRLSLSPLKFLRRDLRKSRKRGALPLGKHIPIMTRFRLRIVMQNLPNYLILFIGILFANLLLFFGLLLPTILHHYQDTIGDSMLADYQYILQLPAGSYDEDNRLESAISLLRFGKAVETEQPEAEKFTAYSLKIPEKGDYKGEDVMIYGIEENSRYIRLRPKRGEVYISGAYADKMGLAPGDVITLKEEYEDTEYTFEITGVYPYDGALALFMDRGYANEVFDLGKDVFTGYFSSEPITDIPDRYIGQVIDLEALTKISRQLDISMGGMMKVLDVFSMLMFMVMIYVLTRIIIEKNAQSISLTKILGYRNREISGLYVRSTSIVVVLFMILSLPVVKLALEWLYRTMIISKMSGWIPFYTPAYIYAQMLVMGLATYLAVAVLEYRKVKKIPMNEALKNVE